MNLRETEPPFTAGDNVGMGSDPLRGETAPHIHVLTLTPFFPSSENEVSGCFVKEPLDHVAQFGIVSRVFAVSPVHYPRRSASPSSPARWVRFPQLPGNLGLSSAGRFLYACALRRVTQLHRGSPIHLIHAHAALPCGHAAALLGHWLQIPFIVTVHGLDVFNAYQGEGTAARWRRERSVNVYQAAKTVVCVSRKIEQILHSGMPGRVRSAVVYNSADIDRFSPFPVENDPNRQCLLAVGNLIPTKGQELILRAMARLTSSFPQLRCQFIGEGPARAYLESLSVELGIGARVEFLGRRTRAEVAQAMRSCSVFVLPSRSEGLGCVYLEAMACGKPVIACRGQGIEEAIEHGRNGWLIPADGLDELVDAISKLTQDQDLSRKLGTMARETILNRFTLSHQARALNEIYRGVIALK